MRKILLVCLALSVLTLGTVAFAVAEPEKIPVRVIDNSSDPVAKLLIAKTKALFDESPQYTVTESASGPHLIIHVQFFPSADAASATTVLFAIEWLIYRMDSGIQLPYYFNSAVTLCSRDTVDQMARQIVARTEQNLDDYHGFGKQLLLSQRGPGQDRSSFLATGSAYAPAAR